MKKFLGKDIPERQLYKMTPIGARYDTIYLCSALVLEEFRRKGITKQLTLEAIEEIRKGHTIKALFVWSFTREGELAVCTIAKLASLPLYKRAASN